MLRTITRTIGLGVVLAALAFASGGIAAQARTVVPDSPDRSTQDFHRNGGTGDFHFVM